MIIPDTDFYYQHQYGGIYRVKSVAISSIDKSKWVVYVHIYPFEHETWIRPYEEWCDGRFKKLNNDSELNLFLDKPRKIFQSEIIAAGNKAKG